MFVFCSYSKATEKKCEWAVNLFNKWKYWRNEKAAQTAGDQDTSPVHVELLDMTKDELCFSLTRFTLEAKKTSGQPYPAETLYEIVISIQLYLALNGREMKFLNDPEFVTLKNTLDTRMKDLTQQGIRVRRRQAEIISVEEEDKMWNMAVLGDTTPQKLVDTILYMFGVHFALRAGTEHRNLRHINSQISLHKDTNVRAFENKLGPNKCIVRLYEKYVVGWMQEGRKCILMIFQEERFSVLQQNVHRK